MKEIKLTGKKGYSTIVDDEDYERLKNQSWGVVMVRSRGETASRPYAVRRFTENGGKRSAYLHREILGLAHGDGIEGDHENGDTLDNRRTNLRRATRSQNAQAIKGCGLKVEPESSALQLNYRKTGAARAYDQAAVQQFGEFAKLNFP